MKNREDTILKLYDLNIKRYKIITTTEGCIVNVDGDVDLRQLNPTTIPISFGEVSGNFYSGNKLKSLDNSPHKIEGNFYCVDTHIENLINGPEYVGGDFICTNGILSDLEGSPQYVGGDYNISFNNVINLKNSPDFINKNFICNNNKLSNLLYSPKKILGSYICHDNKLETLEGITDVVHDLICYNNLIYTFRYAPKEIRGDLFIYNNNIETFEGDINIIGGYITFDTEKIKTFNGLPNLVILKRRFAHSSIEDTKNIDRLINQFYNDKLYYEN